MGSSISSERYNPSSPLRGTTPPLKMKRMNWTFSRGYLPKYFQFFTCSLHYLCIHFWIIVFFCILSWKGLFYNERGRRGRDRMVAGFTTTRAKSVPITTEVVSSNPLHVDVYSMQHYVIKFVSDLRQVAGFLRVLKYCWKWGLSQ